MSGKGDLTEEIRQAFANPRAEPWFPSVTRRLVIRAEEERLEPIGLSLSTYGTERFLRRHACAQRDSVHDLEAAFDREIIVEQLGVDVERFYGKLGLNFLTRARFNENAFATLQQAFQCIEQIPSLSASTKDLVRSVHLLDAGEDAYDVSHSDPSLPFSVFVSVPSIDVPNAALRVMESIVHEAMHLQLTLIEGFVDIVQQTDKRFFSPWRIELRPPTGLLHGIYVFTNIARLFQLLLPQCEPNSTNAVFIEQRLIQVTRELEAAFLSLSPDVLTTPGEMFLALLHRKRAHVIAI